MPEHVHGLKKIELAPYEADGVTIGAYEEVGSTGIGTMQLTSEEGEQTNINVEEKSQPVLSIRSDSVINLVWDILDVSSEQMTRFFGGTETGTGTVADPYVYHMPAKILSRLFRGRITTEDNKVIVFGKINATPRLNWTFTKNDVGKISIGATVVEPPVGIDPVTITYPGVD